MENYLGFVEESLEGEAFSLVVVLEEIFASVPGVDGRQLDGQGLPEQALHEVEVHLPIVLFKVRGDLFKELVESLEAEFD